VIRAVILDWAGTIVDHGSRAPVAAFVELFRRRGVEVTDAEARAPMGQNKKDHIRAIATATRVAGAWRAAHGRAPGEDDIDEMYAAFVPIQRNILADFSAPIAGVADALAAFRARGLRIGTTTGYSREMMEVVVPRAGLDVDCVVTASDVPAGRPAPWMALEAARQLGVYPMRAIVKLGDTLADIEEGRNAGMWAVGITDTGNELGLPGAADRMLAAGAHDVIPALTHAPAIVDELGRRVARGETP